MRQLTPTPGWVVIAVGLTLVSRSARADVQDWQVNEVMTQRGGDPNVRYVELRNDVGGCLFPSSRLEVFDAAGALVGNVAPFASTTCFGPNTYFLLATSAAETALGTKADHNVVPNLPVMAGQVCFSSSTTRYDCVRWGAIGTPIPDFFGPMDTTAIAPAKDGNALVRVATTHVVEVDWEQNLPTPRGPNDGTPWTPPDAGPMPDAAPPVDAAPPGDASSVVDALPFRDAAIDPDARGQRFLDVDPVGGADCGCRGGPTPDGVLLVLFIGGFVLRRRHHA